MGSEIVLSQGGSSSLARAAMLSIHGGADVWRQLDFRLLPTMNLITSLSLAPQCLRSYTSVVSIVVNIDVSSMFASSASSLMTAAEYAQ